MTLPRAALAGLLLGLAQLSKFTALFLVPLFLLLPLAIKWRQRRNPPPPSPCSYPRLGMVLATILLIAWATLLAGYRWQWDPSAFAAMRFRSQLFQAGQSYFTRIPLPPDYLAGLDAQLSDSEHSPMPNYLLGHWYQGKKWYYFPIALAVKTPVPIWLGFLAALFLPGPAPRPKRRFLPDEIGLLVVIIFVYLGLTLPSELQLGIRYLLPLFPLAYVLMGRLGTLGSPSGRGRWRIPALAGLGLWLLLGTLRMYPHYLAYFNELAGGPDRGYKILLDSNLDWGQDLPGLAEYMQKHHVGMINLAYFGHVDPAVYGIHYDLLQTPNPSGLTAISAAYLMGFPYPVLYTDPWAEIPLPITTAFQKRAPITKIGYSIFLFQD